nr:ferredoxin [Sphingomonas sp. CDS-1]
MTKITIDYEACCGVGYCAQVAPEVFAVVDDKVTLIDGVDVESVDGKLLTRAARACPWRVIGVSETD